jgi:predicted DNA-binding protein (MmcQ/YjbR family)
MQQMQMMPFRVMKTSIADAPRSAKRLVRNPRWWHDHAMTRLIVNSFCATLQGAEVSDPWGGGHDAWKVGGKMFACIGSQGGGVSVKTPDIDTARLLIEMGHATRAPYFHASWVRVPWGLVPDDELRERLDASYWLIRASLPKKVQAQL